MSKHTALNVTGVTWLDVHYEQTLKDLDAGLARIVADACRAHERRLGRRPNVILVHPDLLSEPRHVNGVLVRPEQGILRAHYHAVYLEGEDEPPAEEPATLLEIEIPLG